MIWLDAHLSPRLAHWVREDLATEAQALREIGLRDAEDEVLFARARDENVVIPTKDRDFVEIVGRGAPPYVVWLHCGETSESSLKSLFRAHLEVDLAFIVQGESLAGIQ